MTVFFALTAPRRIINIMTLSRNFQLYLFINHEDHQTKSSILGIGMH